MRRIVPVLAACASFEAIGCTNDYAELAIDAASGAGAGSASTGVGKGGGSGAATGPGGSGAQGSGGTGATGAGSDGGAVGGGGSGGNGGAPPSCGVRLTLGSDHTCIHRATGEARCWGWNYWGQLGDGSTTDSALPATPAALGPVKSLATRFFHGCAVRVDGTVACWGQNDQLQLGGADSLVPAQVGGLSGFDEVAVGRIMSCARAGGGVWCWGSSPANGTNMSGSSPVQVSGIGTAVAIAAGASHACAVLGDETARCWGDNTYGQFGNGTTTSTPTPVTISVAGGIAQIVAAGFDIGSGPGTDGGSTCILKQGGGVLCSGDNYYGQLGDGTNADSATFVEVDGLADAVQLAIGRYHVCARRAGGGVVCWGGNEDGQLGNGTLNDSNVPTPVSNIAGAVRIAASGEHSCALLADSTLQCWGNDTDAQLGDAAANDYHSTPVLSHDVCQ